MNLDFLRKCDAAKDATVQGLRREAGLPSEVKTYVEKPKTLAELRAGIAEGHVKASELAVRYYDRIAEVNPQLNI